MADALTALDLAGTFVFAVSGAFKAVRKQLDWLGIAVLAVLTGVGGGLLRDALLGATPAAAVADERYLLACLLGAAAVVVAARPISARWSHVMVADGLGLGLFAALGATKAAAVGLGPIGVIGMGTLTAVGGGVIRDVLVGERPAVLDRGFYATAALLGSALLVGLNALGVSPLLQITAAAVTTSALRFVAMARRTHLPRPEAPPLPTD